MTTSQILNCMGLCIDILGVILLFIYGLPANINKEGHILMAFEDEDENEKMKWEKFNFRSRIGLTCIIIGFIFQILATSWTIIEASLKSI